MLKASGDWSFKSGYVVLLALLVTMAACGRVGPDNVSTEQVLIRHDGTIQDVVIDRYLHPGDESAVWIFPVPNPAEVSLVQNNLFFDLANIATPQTRFRYWLVPLALLPLAIGLLLRSRYTAKLLMLLLLIGAGNVTAQQQLGPLDVTQLEATDPASLEAWLREHGFTPPPALAATIAPYSQHGWSYLVVRLRPSSNATFLSGQLTPLHVRFASPTIMYPMRINALNQAPKNFEIYVLTNRRVEKGQRYGEEKLLIAAPIQPSDLPPESPLAEFIDRPLYLTGFIERITDPARISGDYHFVPVPNGPPLYRTTYNDLDMALAAAVALVATAIATQILTGDRQSGT